MDPHTPIPIPPRKHWEASLARYIAGSSEERHYVQQDANFNVTAVTDRYGSAVLERYIYDPYGQATVIDDDWSSDANGISDIGWVYLHQGGRYDSVAGLYHFRNRDYSPTLGRWTRQDPMGYMDGTSLYQYVKSNPVRFTDPNGQQATCMSYATNGPDRGLNAVPVNAALQAGVISPATFSRWMNTATGESEMYNDFYVNPSLFRAVMNAHFGSQGQKNPANCPCDRTKQRRVCAYVYWHPAAGYDMHWIVEHSDGSWSEQHGTTGVIGSTSPRSQSGKKLVGCWTINTPAPAPIPPPPPEWWDSPIYMYPQGA